MRLAGLIALTVTVTVAVAVTLGACGAPDKGTIGAVLGQRGDGRVFVREVPEDLAAGKAGLQPGDEVLLIEGRDVRFMTPKEIHEQLVGTVGEPVKLTLIRGEEVLRVTLERTQARHRLLAGGAGPKEKE